MCTQIDRKGIMTRKFLGLAAVCAIALGAVSPASADVITSFTATPDGNGEFTFDVGFNITPDPGYLGAAFSTYGTYGANSVTIDFGDGSSLTSSPLVPDISFLHTYSPGAYFPTLSGLINYEEWWNIFGLQYDHTYQIVNGSTSIQVNDLAPVPGPIAGAGLPGLMAACFGLLILTKRRRNRCEPALTE
jgi:hypothetical protein